VKLTTRTVTTALRAPFVAGHGTVTDRDLVLVTLEAGDGQVGHGEAAPLPSYDGVSAADVVAALDACRPVLADYRDAAPIADVLARCGEATVLSQALAAIDLGDAVPEAMWRAVAEALAWAYRLDADVARHQSRGN